MSPDREHLEAEAPEGWEVAEEADLGLSVFHHERDVAVTVRRREVSTAPVRSRTPGEPSRTVFEVGYRPPSVDGRSIHLSTETCPERAVNRLLEAIRDLEHGRR